MRQLFLLKKRGSFFITKSGMHYKMRRFYYGKYYKTRRLLQNAALYNTAQIYFHKNLTTFTSKLYLSAVKLSKTELRNLFSLRR